MYSVQDTLAGGFPHSEIHGSKFVRNSPWLIAAYDVLHRLSAPRHPPNALKTLDRSHYRCPSTRQQTESIEKTSFFEVMPDRRRLRLRIRSRHATPPGQHSNKTFSSRCQITRAHRHSGHEFLLMRTSHAVGLPAAAYQGARLVEPDGIEPTTSCLQSRRSPN